MRLIHRPPMTTICRTVTRLVEDVVIEGDDDKKFVRVIYDTLDATFTTRIYDRHPIAELNDIQTRALHEAYDRLCDRLDRLHVDHDDHH